MEVIANCRARCGDATLSLRRLDCDARSVDHPDSEAKLMLQLTVARFCVKRVTFACAKAQPQW
jgi:hypothetical protein